MNSCTYFVWFSLYLLLLEILSMSWFKCRFFENTSCVADEANLFKCCPILLHRILSHPIPSYRILSYPILSNPILSYPSSSVPIAVHYCLGQWSTITRRKRLTKINVQPCNGQSWNRNQKINDHEIVSQFLIPSMYSSV